MQEELDGSEYYVKKLRFSPEELFIAVHFSPLSWGFAFFFDGVQVSLELGPLMIAFGIPFWFEVIDTNNVVHMEDYRGPKD